MGAADAVWSGGWRAAQVAFALDFVHYSILLQESQHLLRIFLNILSKLNKYTVNMSYFLIFCVCKNGAQGCVGCQKPLSHGRRIVWQKESGLFSVRCRGLHHIE